MVEINSENIRTLKDKYENIKYRDEQHIIRIGISIFKLDIPKIYRSKIEKMEKIKNTCGRSIVGRCFLSNTSFVLGFSKLMMNIICLVHDWDYIRYTKIEDKIKADKRLYYNILRYSYGIGKPILGKRLARSYLWGLSGKKSLEAFNEAKGDPKIWENT